MGVVFPQVGVVNVIERTKSGGAETGGSGEWNMVEDCLKEYIGECAEVTETSDVVYIGTDFPDEFAHSKDTKELRAQICMQRQILRV